jgi:hypothetical protein
MRGNVQVAVRRGEVGELEQSRPGLLPYSFLLEMRDHLNREQSLHGDGIVVILKVGL